MSLDIDIMSVAIASKHKSEKKGKKNLEKHPEIQKFLRYAKNGGRESRLARECYTKMEPELRKYIEVEYEALLRSLTFTGM